MKNMKYFKEYVKYSFLNVLGMLGLSFYIFVDTLFISWGVGANGLTALNLAIPVYNFVHGSSLMLGMGGATKYTIYKSKNKQDGANTIFTTSVILAAVFSCLFVWTGLFLSESITKILGANTEIFGMTNIYIKVILLFSPAFMTNDIFICFVRNDGNPQLSMFAMLIGSLANVVLDYILIFPMQMGIFGAVLATGFAPVISMLILSLHWMKKKHTFHFIRRRLEWRKIRGILALGFPSLITEVSSGIVIIVFNMIILSLKGNLGVAAYGIIANLSLVVIAIFTGIAQGIQPLFSRAYGYNDTKNIKLILRYAINTIILISATIYVMIFFFADSITLLFNSGHNLQLQQMAVEGLKLYFTALIFAGFNIIISVYFTSTENPMPAHVISILRGLIMFVPMTIVLSVIAGITGVWLSFPVTEGIVAMLGIIMYVFQRKKG